MIYQKYRTIEYDPVEKTSRGVDKERIQYFTYEYEKTKKLQNAGQMLQTCGDGISNAVFQGISTAEKIPSLGDWERSLGEQSMQIYYGSPSFLNVVSPTVLVKQMNLSKVDFFVVCDRINNRKNLLRKY